MNKSKEYQDKKLKDLKSKIANFDLAVPGTIRTIYTRCGKQNCVCQTDKDARHGPYCLWDRKVNGKLSSKMVTKKMASQINMWIENRNKLKRSVQAVLDLSQKIAVKIIEKDRISATEKK